MEPVDVEFHELISHELPTATELWGSGLGTQVEPRKVFYTNDLIVRDEARDKNWILKGRRDDMLILVDGRTNVSAVEVESAIKKKGEDLVRLAMLVGQGREKTGLLVELQKGEYMRKGEEEVWNIVERGERGPEGEGKGR
ncbi:MAG: hypothetical protein Q9166_000076 [cf. Caloplaca sp. 2 TL-2023]